MAVDLPQSIGALARFAATHHGDQIAARAKRDGAWAERTFADAAASVERLALGLIDQGIEPGDRVCVLADTSPEWTIAAYAIWSAGAVVVPVYPTNSPQECEWVAGNSGAVAVLAENRVQLDKIRAVRDALPEVRLLATIDPAAADDDAVAVDAIAAAASADRGELDRRIAALTLDDPFLIIYTSGTTGPPKGCVLSQRNGLSVCRIVYEFGTVRTKDVGYLYLPLAHVFAQLLNVAAYAVGATIVYYGGNTREIIPELQEVRPDYLPSVPRIFEKLYAMGIGRLPADQAERLRQAVALGVDVQARRLRGEPVPEDRAAAYAQADERVFAPVRNLFGGRTREATTGAAPIAKEILEFFYAAGVPVMEGYGMTESTGLGAANRPTDFRFGTVGKALPDVELRIAGDGEILMRGPHVFLGYWANEEATREVLDEDGWLHTGDLGSIDDDGFLSITGRKKDIIITAGGKNLTPANLENDLKQSRFVSQAVMYGDRRPYPVALVTLDAEEIQPWARDQGLPDDIGALAADDRVRALIQEHLDGVNAKYAQVEQIKRFTILDHDLTLDRGEITPTLKIKRNVVYERYADVFDRLYA